MSKQVSHPRITFLLVLIAMMLMLMACTTTAVTPAATLPTSTARPPVAVPTAQPTEQPVVVAFVKDGDIYVWDSETRESELVFTAGDVFAVTMSDDGQVVAFLRRSWVETAEMEWFQQSALWAVERNGENPRELVSAEGLRQWLDAGERDSTNISQMDWIPGTHRLLYSGWTYLVQAEGESHATPKGLFLVDTDTLTDTVLVPPAGNNLRFVPSPDGGQIALMYLDALSFINVDGSNRRQDILTYSPVGEGGPLFPTGVWSQDSRAFVFTGSLENDSGPGINFTIWRVPVDGLPPEALANISRSDPRLVTFSPDGQHVAFIQQYPDQRSQPVGWFISPLSVHVGPLAIPYFIDLAGYANLHWSPAGDAFTGNLLRLCPAATRDSEVCEPPLNFFGVPIAAIQWIDGTRFVFLTGSPPVLFLARMDGLAIPIVAWSSREISHSFAAYSAAQHR